MGTKSAKFGRLWGVDLAGLAGGLAVTVVACLVGFKPLIDRSMERADQQRILEQQRLELRELTQLAHQLSEQLGGIREAVRNSHVQLLPVDRLNRRVAMLTEMAAKAGVEVAAVQPGEVRHGRRYEVVPISLQGQGSYRRCAAFIHRLHREFPDVGVVGFEITAGQGPSRENGEFLLKLAWHAAPALASSQKP